MGGEDEAGMTSKNYHFDLMNFRENMSIESPLNDGIVEDWDLVDQLWDHALTQQLRTDLKGVPVMMTEKSYAPLENKQK